MAILVFGIGNSPLAILYVLPGFTSLNNLVGLIMIPVLVDNLILLQKCKPLVYSLANMCNHCSEDCFKQNVRGSCWHELHVA